MHARILIRPKSSDGSQILDQLERRRNIKPDGTRVYRVDVQNPGQVDVFVPDLDQLNPRWRDHLDYDGVNA